MRADGKKIKNIDPVAKVMPYFMSKRYDAMNMITLDIPVDPMWEYINEKRREGKSISNLALILAAFLRATAEYPGLNRFVINKKIYARNQFAVGMVVLRPGTEDGGINKMYFELTDDIFTVQDKITAYIIANKNQNSVNETDKTISKLLKMPGLLPIAVNILKLLDKYGFLPMKLLNASPFHSTCVISNLGSIRTNHVYHHCYHFGTTSFVVTMGNTREVPKRLNGEIVFQKCLPLGV
ncbi:MAG: hypothetical protein RR387_02295, partial [Clostridiales bacterium]